MRFSCFSVFSKPNKELKPLLEKLQLLSETETAWINEDHVVVIPKNLYGDFLTEATKLPESGTILLGSTEI